MEQAQVKKIFPDISLLALIGGALLILLASGMVAYSGAMAVFGIIAVSGLIYLAWKNLPTALGVLAALVLLIPEGVGAWSYFSINLLGFNIRYIELVLLVILGVWLFKLLIGSEKWRSYVTGTILISAPLILWLAVASYHGILNGSALTDFMNDIRSFSYYLVILPVITSLKSNEDRDKLLSAFIFGAAGFSILFFALSYIESFVVGLMGLSFPGLFQELRFNFRNTSFFFLPWLLSIVFIKYETKPSLKIMYLLSLLAITLGVILSQTRTLWAVLVACGIIFLVLSVWQKQMKWQTVLKSLALILIIVTLLISIPWVRDSKLYGQTLERVKTLTNINYADDASYRFRVSVTPQIIEETKENPVFGVGLGQPVRIEYRNQFYDLPYIDNSYLMIAYKAGVPGLLAMLAFFLYYGWKLLVVVFKRKLDAKSLMIASALIASLLGFLTFGLSTVMLTNYAATLLLGIIFGITEYLYYKSNHEQATT
ncbi:MAG: O-antigen ligase family protein [bacterium]